MADLALAPAPVPALKSAFEHTRRICFGPFRLRKWLRLGLVNLFAGGSSGAGGSGGNGYSGNGGDKESGSASAAQPDFKESLNTVLNWINDHIGLLVLGAALMAAMAMVWIWICSVFNFVFLENVIRDRDGIGEPFHRLRPLGTSYFWWNLFLALLLLGMLIVLVGLPLLGLILSTTQSGPGAEEMNVAGLVASIIGAILAFLLVLFIWWFIYILGKDLISVVMLIDQVGVIEAWRRLLPLIKRHPGPFAIYLLLRLGISIGGGVVIGIAVLVLILVLLIPLGILAVLVYILATATGLGFSLPIILLSVVLALAALLVLVYLCSVLAVPVEVFYRSYGIEFLGQCEERWKYPVPAV